MRSQLHLGAEEPSYYDERTNSRTNLRTFYQSLGKTSQETSRKILKYNASGSTKYDELEFPSAMKHNFTSTIRSSVPSLGNPSYKKPFFMNFVSIGDGKPKDGQLPRLRTDTSPKSNLNKTQGDVDFRNHPEFSKAFLSPVIIGNKFYRDPRAFPIQSYDPLQNYHVKLKTDVRNLENSGSAINVLEGLVEHPFKLIESYIDSVKKDLQEIGSIKEEIHVDIELMKTDLNTNLQEATEAFQKGIKSLKEEIKKDFLKQTNFGFAEQKEITKLKKSLMDDEQNIKTGRRRLKRVEQKLFGEEIFKLDSNNELVKGMPQSSLRADLAGVFHTKHYI